MPEVGPAIASERWQRVKSLFQSALDQDPNGRSAFLGGACGGDSGLRREVGQLLACHDQAGAFLEEPAALPPPSVVSLIGKRVGAYLILDEIGRGGMGRVYRAVRADDSFQREVAVKVAAGAFDGEAGARFLKERQILARLQHPNIATLHDAGATDEGQAYLVMELVEGQPLDAYCNARRLSVRERLALFRTVCDAVHYAHQNLVVHRDLKPGNILVAAGGVPKLLDFGISKLLAPEGEVDGRPTATLLPLLTPEYASPEQVRGAAVTTVSDVYSLGVVLYELLAGVHPYEMPTRSAEEVMRVVCGVEPERPSTAARRAKPSLSRSGLEGDLDTIVLKCLRKEAARRYGSARELADDIGHYLQGRPVRARPDSTTYRASKFVRRHLTAVAAATLAGLALVGTTLVALEQAREARQARTRAEKRFQDVRRLAHSVIFELHDGIERLPGSTSVRELLVKRALEYLGDLDGESRDDPRLRAELAAAYEKIGDVQGGVAYQNLGHRAEALASYRRALAIRRELAARFPDDPDQQRDLSRIYARFGMLSSWDGDFHAAMASYSLQLQAGRTLLRLRPGGAQGRRVTAMALANVGQARSAVGELEPGLADLREAVALFERLSQEDPPELRKAGYDVDDNLASVRMMFAESLLAATDRAPEALAELGPAIAFREARLREAPLDADAKAKLAFLIATAGDAAQRASELVEAGRFYERASVLCDELLAADPSDEETRYLWLAAQVSRGEVEVKAGRAAAGEARLRSALERLRGRPATPDARFAKLAALAERALAVALEARPATKPGDACPHHLRAQDAWSRALGGRPLTRADAGLAREIGTAADRCRAPARLAARS